LNGCFLVDLQACPISKDMGFVHPPTRMLVTDGGDST